MLVISCSSGCLQIVCTEVIALVRIGGWGNRDGTSNVATSSCMSVVTTRIKSTSPHPSALQTVAGVVAAREVGDRAVSVPVNPCARKWFLARSINPLGCSFSLLNITLASLFKVEIFHISHQC